jgi:hypothetical protein
LIFLHQIVTQQYPEQVELLSFIAETVPQNRFIHNAYSHDRENLEFVLMNVCTALQHLPKKGEYERLSIFSQKVLKDPHAFDLYTFQGKVFFHALQFYSEHLVAKLESLTIEELQPIKEKMQQIKKAGYQEEILMKLHRDIYDWL